VDDDRDLPARHAVDLVEKKHRVAVIRVLRGLKGWSYSHRPGHEGVLWTKWSHESRLKACWLYDHAHMTFEAFLHTEAGNKAQRQRDEATRGGKAEFELVSMTRAEFRAWRRELDRSEKLLLLPHFRDVIDRRWRKLAALSGRLQALRPGLPK
jgi:hypothetical protein